MHDVAVIDDPAAAEASLDPIRARLLAELAEPGSASTLASRVGLTRQKANYHLRSLERHGLVELVEERRKGNCTERVLQATAASYVISPTALSAVAPDPSREPDQRSARWLLAVAGRMVREVGDLITGASAAGKPLATLGIDSEVRFASAKDRAAFAAELAGAVNGLVAKYHDEAAPGGRRHRFVVALHPTITHHQGAPVMSREFEVSREIDLPAARTTSGPRSPRILRPGCSRRGWRSPPAPHRPRAAPITTWDPPHRLVVRMESPDGTFNALDYAIEARAGGTAHLRYVHSGILADGWEDQYDAIDGHTDFYLHTLAQYLEHFNGRQVTYVGQPSDGINGPASAGPLMPSDGWPT